jgi:PRC-barrel domain
MTIANVSNPNTLTGAPVRGSKGEKLGKIDAIYLDNATDAPEWAAVKSGLVGGHVSLVPLVQASWDGDTLTVPVDKQALQAAPHHDPDAALSAADEDELYRHYGLSAGRGQVPRLDEVVSGVSSARPSP